MGKATQYVANPFIATARDTISAGTSAALGPLTEEQRKAREQAERLAAQQREALAKLQADPAAAIPIADEEARKGRRASIIAQMRRRGRQSTILTGEGGAPGDALGA